jgi:hypothetical protein
MQQTVNLSNAEPHPKQGFCIGFQIPETTGIEEVLTAQSNESKRF